MPSYQRETDGMPLDFGASKLKKMSVIPMSSAITYMHCILCCTDELCEHIKCDIIIIVCNNRIIIHILHMLPVQL